MFNKNTFLLILGLTPVFCLTPFPWISGNLLPPAISIALASIFIVFGRLGKRYRGSTALLLAWVISGALLVVFVSALDVFDSLRPFRFGRNALFLKMSINPALLLSYIGLLAKVFLYIDPDPSCEQQAEVWHSLSSKVALFIALTFCLGDVFFFTRTWIENNNLVWAMILFAASMMFYLAKLPSRMPNWPIKGKYMMWIGLTISIGATSAFGYVVGTIPGLNILGIFLIAFIFAPYAKIGTLILTFGVLRALSNFKSYHVQVHGENVEPQLAGNSPGEIYAELASHVAQKPDDLKAGMSLHHALMLLPGKESEMQKNARMLMREMVKQRQCDHLLEVYHDCMAQDKPFDPGADLTVMLARQAGSLKDYTSMLDILRDFEQRYPAHKRTPGAWLLLARAHQGLRNGAQAINYLKMVLTRYPQSEEVQQANEWLRMLGARAP